MRKIDYLLIVVAVILLPFAVISFKSNETNFLLEEKVKPKSKDLDISVNLVNGDDILTLSLNDYLIGVVSAEMPASFSEEALKAQAVAARTYTLAKYKEGEPITIRITEQAYLSNEELKKLWEDNYETYYNKIKDCVDSTNNEVITYNGNLIHAYYYAMSNGYTEDAAVVFKEELPYLSVLASPYEEENKNFSYDKEFSYEEFLKFLSLDNREFKIENVVRNGSNRVDKITINGKTFTGIEVRTLLDLRSTDFKIVKTGEIITVTTKGYGHGVGMSQYGANYMAKEGKTYPEILTYYYQNTKIGSYEV